MKKKLAHFRYAFDKGPVSIDRLNEQILDGNCRLAVQHYFHIHGIELEPEEVLCPKLFMETGQFFETETGTNFFQALSGREIIFAERIRDKNLKAVDKSRDRYGSEADWCIDLHTAIYLGKGTAEPIWHATAIEADTCFWAIEKFLQYYKPVAVKKIVKN